MAGVRTLYLLRLLLFSATICVTAARPIGTASHSEQSIQTAENEEEDDIRPLLYVFAEFNLTEDAQSALNRGADPNEMVTVDGCKMPLLHLAVVRNQGHVVEQLSSFGADIYGLDCNNHTALERAILTGRTLMIRPLVGAGYNLNLNPTLSRLNMPLMVALERGLYGAASELAKNGADLKYQYPDGDLYIHKAARSGELGNVFFFLDGGVDIDIMNGKQETVLFISIETKNNVMTNSLLNRGAKPERIFADGESYLHLAVKNNNPSAIVPLLMHSAPIDAIDLNKQTALHLACQIDSAEAVKILVNRGSNLDLEDGLTHKPLSVASFYGKLAAAEALIDAGDNVNRQNHGSWAPLHEAGFNGHTDVARLLLDRGANVNIRNGANKTPLRLAIERNHQDTADLIRSRGGVE